MKHTPGPWDLEFSPLCQTAKVWARSTGGSVSGVVATLHVDWPHEDQREEQKANAHLMHAAPDLLKALKLLMPVPLTGNPSTQTLREFWEYEHGQGRGGAKDVLFAMYAIAKAEKLESMEVSE